MPARRGLIRFDGALPTSSLILRLVGDEEVDGFGGAARDFAPLQLRTGREEDDMVYIYVLLTGSKNGTGHQLNCDNMVNM